MEYYPAFNVGDRVECIDACPGLRYGHQYTVSGFWPDPRNGKHMIEFEGGNSVVYYTRRFKPVELDILGDNDDDCI